MLNDEAMALETVELTHPDARLLIDEVQAEYVERYGGPDETELDPDDFTPPNGLFIVGYVGGRPMATGAWRKPTRAHLGANWTNWDLEREPLAEIKRMFVNKAYRRRGFSRLMLAELERTARDAGIAHLILETGTMQPEAIALYRSAGYEPVDGFGHYCAHELSRHFGKQLRDSDRAVV